MKGIINVVAAKGKLIEQSTPLRHTFATTLIKKSDIKEVSNILGHSDISTSLNIYYDVQREEITATDVTDSVPYNL